MSLFNNAIIGASGQGGYRISRSVRLRSSASAYFNRTPASSGNQQKFTFSFWVKRGAISTQQVVFGLNSASTNIFTISFLSGDTLRVFGRNAGSDVLNLTTTAVYRDPSAWYHIVIAIDTTQATSSNRALMYVNGVQVTAFGTATYPAQNTSLAWNSNSYSHQIGREDTGNYLDGYLTEINFIDGQALTPSSFGETNAVTGVWQPKKYAGTYGTNGFYLNFSDNSGATATTIGKDYSGNGNNWTPNNISVTAGTTYDSMLDVPTLYADGGNGRGNYCVMNPLKAGSSSLLSQGNLAWTYSSGSASATPATFSISSGKWYHEVTITSANINHLSGWADATNSIYVDIFNIGATNGIEKSSGTTSGSSFTFANNDILGIAFDYDNATITFYKNNTSQFSVSAITLSGALMSPIQGIGSSGGGASSCVYNFGQRPFAYTPPTGFKALNTQNLPTPTIVEGNAYFDVVTRNGTGSAVSVSSLSFQPDSILTKLRNTAYNWYWADAVRGVSKTLSTDTTAAEQTPSPALFTSFNSDGYTLGTNTGSNGSTYTYVDYVWNAGGSTVTNTSGSISAQVRANPTAGFSVVTYTGTGANATVGHGLGVAPSMVIVKPRSTTGNWSIWHTKLTSGAYALFFNTDAQGSYPTIWNSTIPTSTVFSIGTASGTNVNGQTQVAYCFAAVAGYSAFGSYTGNGSADGPFVYLGFRPKFVFWKNASTTSDWQMKDAARSTYNVTSANLYANLSTAENSAGDVDFLSNGFKLRSAGTDVNGSGNTIIYAAFAENPFKLSLAR